MIKKLFTIFAILISITTFNSTSHSIEADVFVQSTVNRAASTLGGNLTKEQRVKELKKNS
jgi:phospholipid transport system substrate-binding protein